MTLYEIDPVRDERWLPLIERHTRSSIFHTPQWLRALQRTYSYEPVAFTDARPGSPLRNGLLFCRVRSWITGSRLVSLPFSDHCDLLVESADVLTEMVNALRTRIPSEGRYIELRPLTRIAVLDGLQPSAEYCVHEIDLRPDLATIFARFHRNHMQRNVRKAERLGMAVESGRTPGLVAAFYALHVSTRCRQRLPVQPLVWFQNLMECLGNRATVHVARYKGRAVAAMLTASHQRKLVYKYGCSDFGYKQFGATPLLFWRVIQAAKSRAIEELDLGRTDLQNEGLLAFKDHLGASRRSLCYYRYSPHARRPWKVNATSALEVAAKRFVPAPLLTRAGGMFYRHFA